MVDQVYGWYLPEARLIKVKQHKIETARKSTKAKWFQAVKSASRDFSRYNMRRPGQPRTATRAPVLFVDAPEAPVIEDAAYMDPFGFGNLQPQVLDLEDDKDLERMADNEGLFEAEAKRQQMETQFTRLVLESARKSDEARLTTDATDGLPPVDQTVTNAKDAPVTPADVTLAMKSHGKQELKSSSPTAANTKKRRSTLHAPRDVGPKCRRVTASTCSKSSSSSCKIITPVPCRPAQSRSRAGRHGSGH